MPWPEGYVVKYSAVLSQRDFAFGSAVEIVKYGFWNPITRNRAKIFDADNPGRRYRSCSSRHLESVPEIWKQADILPSIELQENLNFSPAAGQSRRCWLRPVRRKVLPGRQPKRWDFGLLFCSREFTPFPARRCQNSVRKVPAEIGGDAAPTGTPPAPKPDSGVPIFWSPHRCKSSTKRKAASEQARS